jgi:hypothetical protein
MIRYCFPSVDINAIEDEVEFAEIANEADWVIRNIMHPQEGDSKPKAAPDTNVKRRTQ